MVSASSRQCAGEFEQIAGIHAFREYDQLGALANRVFNILRSQTDIVVEISEPGECLYRGGAKTARRHVHLQFIGG